MRSGSIAASRSLSVKWKKNAESEASANKHQNRDGECHIGDSYADLWYVRVHRDDCISPRRRHTYGHLRKISTDLLEREKGTRHSVRARLQMDPRRRPDFYATDGQRLTVGRLAGPVGPRLRHRSSSPRRRREDLGHSGQMLPRRLLRQENRCRCFPRRINLRKDRLPAADRDDRSTRTPRKRRHQTPEPGSTGPHPAFRGVPESIDRLAGIHRPFGPRRRACKKLSVGYTASGLLLLYSGSGHTSAATMRRNCRYYIGQTEGGSMRGLFCGLIITFSVMGTWLFSRSRACAGGYPKEDHRQFSPL